MGYACPVCATPQRDGEHLAHHLAFTAMLHDDDHRAWLDDHAPAWETADPAGLAEAVVEHAPPAEYDEVFEDTTDRGRPAVDTAVGGHEHRHGTGVDSDTGASADPLTPDDTDPETAAALREARELTRQMYDDATGADDTADGDPADADTADGDPADTAADDLADAADGDPDTESADTPDTDSDPSS